jgi:hypothetical protein
VTWHHLLDKWSATVYVAAYTSSATPALHGSLQFPLLPLAQGVVGLASEPCGTSAARDAAYQQSSISCSCLVIAAGTVCHVNDSRRTTVRGVVRILFVFVVYHGFWTIVTVVRAGGHNSTCGHGSCQGMGGKTPQRYEPRYSAHCRLPPSQVMVGGVSRVC